MRCTSFCTATNYNIPELYQFHFKRGSTVLYKDVVHVQVREGKKIKGDIFYFAYGVVVFWGLSEDEEKAFLFSLKAFEKERILTPEIDELTFDYGAAFKIEDDEITLQNRHPLHKLAISFGIAQSVKLGVFENGIQKIINKTQKIPMELSRKGRISLSRKQISKKIGELFIQRNYINLNTEVLEEPEFFWEHPELEPFYRRIANYLEISKRADFLNKRLNVIHELFEILGNELNHQHSSRLEWIIIVLILIEVSIVLLKEVFHFL